MPRIGVLALQGDFLAHARALESEGVETSEVRRCGDLDGLHGLVIPGGESTTLLNLMGDEPWFEKLGSFHEEGGALFGTCAGAILLSKRVTGPDQPSLGLLDAGIRRNAYGRQKESFEIPLDLEDLGGSVDAVFIRAPRFTSLGPEVRVLGRLGDEPVLVRQGRILAATFHPELTGDGRLHRYFCGMAVEDRPEAPRGPRVATMST